MTEKYVPVQVSELMETSSTRERKERNKRWARRTLCALAGIAMIALPINISHQIRQDYKQEREQRNISQREYYDANNIPYIQFGDEVKPILGQLEIKSDKFNLLKDDEKTSESY